MAGQRPGGVTLVAVLVWIQALLYLVVGIFALVAMWAPAFVADLQFDFAWGLGLLWNGILGIAFGITLFIISGGLLRGSRVARALVTIALILSIIGAVTALVNGQVIGGIIALAIAIIGI